MRDGGWRKEIGMCLLLTSPPYEYCSSAEPLPRKPCEVVVSGARRRGETLGLSLIHI